MAKKKKKAGLEPTVPVAVHTSQKGSPLVTILTVLLILVGVADAALWGLAGYYFLQNARNGSGGGTTQNASAGGSAAQSTPDGGSAAQSTPDGGAETGGGDQAGDAEGQEALVAYIQQISEVEDLRNQMAESLSSVNGTNYTDDATMLDEVSERTLPLCREMDEKVVAIVPSDPEISELHGIYRDYSTKALNALSMLNSALVNQDVAQSTEANNLINEANDLVTDYWQRLRSLAEDRGVTLNG